MGWQLRGNARLLQFRVLKLLSKLNTLTQSLRVLLLLVRSQFYNKFKTYILHWSNEYAASLVLYYLKKVTILLRSFINQYSLLSSQGKIRIEFKVASHDQNSQTVVCLLYTSDAADE